MKYNPKINESVALLKGFADIHPLTPSEGVQGALQLMHELGQYLCEIVGLDDISLQPAAGAHGELTSLFMIRAYHTQNGNPRRYVIIPDSSHGTNPASIRMAGYEAVEIKSGSDGLVDIDSLKENIDDNCAALMVTNPNTLGLFEREVDKIADIVHSRGALLYLDGANMNALMGIVRPGEIGFDVVHLNLHKTFSTPHGGGGPGSGPVVVRDILTPYLPVPVVAKDDDGNFVLDFDRPHSIGKVQAFWGAFGVMVKAYAYIRMLGAKGLRKSSERAILNANYLAERLKGIYDLAYKGVPTQEFVVSGKELKRETGVRTLNVAKRLLDYGFHAPTVYFPLIVSEALMIEPTETESRESLDAFAEALRSIVKEAREQPDLVKDAPHTTPVKRLDEAKASRELRVVARNYQGR